MPLRNAKFSRSWIAVGLAMLVLGMYSTVSVPGTRAQETSFVFTAHGDHGEHDSPEFLMSLAGVAQTGASFSLALGDLSYENTGDEQRWCRVVQDQLGMTYPFEIVMGNHEDEDKLNGYIGTFVQYCPDRMNSQGIYGAEYFFDYPVTNPLMRVIMLGAGNDWDWDENGSVEANEHFDYDFSSPARQAHLEWLIQAIDSARNSGIKWLVVGMHKNCLTVGTKTCEIGQQLMNLLIQKKVDLILQGHDHTYQRSKQLSLGSGCSAITAGDFDQDCVVDDGKDGVFEKGAGSLLVVTGHFGGEGLYTVSADDPEKDYFAKAMGGNGWFDFLQSDESHSGVTRGFVKVTVSDSRIIVEHVATTNPQTEFSDVFSVVDNASLNPVPTAMPPQTPQPTADATVTSLAIPGESISPQGTATVMDNSLSTPSATSHVSPEMTEMPTILTFTPVADGYVQATSPDTGRGSNAILRIDASPDIRSYLRFDLQGVSGVIVRATLRIYANSASSAGYNVQGITDNTWTEAGLTYLNAPPLGDIVASSGAFSADTWTTVDVTSSITGDGLVSLALTGINNTAVSFSSLQGTNPPELIIEILTASESRNDAPTLTPTPTVLSSP